MNELQSILNALATLRGSTGSAVLATLVGVDGSSFRSPGARMLILPDNQHIGSITGPCLEAELHRQAALMTPASTPRKIAYNTTADDDAIFGYGLGCKGIVHILLESIDPNRPPQHLEFLRASLSANHPAALATIYAAPAAVLVGSRLFLSDGTFHTSGDWPGDLAASVLQDAHNALSTGHSLTRTYASPAGQTEVFLEIIRPPVRLVIIGATDSSIPLVHFANQLGWHITVIDKRPALADPARFPLADSVISCPTRQTPHHIIPTPRSAAVIMTHNYPDDLELLKTLLALPLQYLGILGSRQRTHRLLQDLAKDTFAAAHHLHGPVGLDIGAETPQEIALSIIAEIQATLANRPGTPLRDRPSLIHDHPCSCPPSKP